MSEEQGQTPKGKASRTEVAARVDEVLRIRMDFAQFHDVVEYAKEKGWNVSLRQLARYIAKADELLVERRETNRRRLLARHVAQREALAARALNAADYRTALAIMDSTAKLQNLFDSERELKNLTAAQAERIRELEKKPGITLEEAKEAARLAILSLPPPPEKIDIPPPPRDNDQ